MNIFEIYLDKILNLIKNAKENNLLELPENLSGINVEIPPAKFNYDMSTNVAMVLSKSNNKSPLELAKVIADIIKKNDENLDDIKIEKPGFINLKFKKIFWNNFLKTIIDQSNYGSNTSNVCKKYLVDTIYLGLLLQIVFLFQDDGLYAWQLSDCERRI